MASSCNKKSKNLEKFGEVFVNKRLNQMEEFFSHMKSVHPSNVDGQVRAKLHTLYAECGYLLSYWDCYDRNIFSEPKVDEFLWMDNVLLKYLFENCVSSDVNKKTGEKYLFCVACKVRLERDSSSLISHLNDETHLNYYKIFLYERKDIIWRGIDMHKWAFEKFIDFRPNNTLSCKLCGIVLPFSQSSLVLHLDGTKHMNNFKKIASYNSFCDEGLLENLSGKSNPEFLASDECSKLGSKNKYIKKIEGKKVEKNKRTDRCSVSKTNRRSNFVYFDPYANGETSCNSDSTNVQINVSSEEHKSNLKPRISVDNSSIKGKNGNKQSSVKKQSEIKSGTHSKFSNKNDGGVPILKDSFLRKSKLALKDIESHGMFMNKVLAQDPGSVNFFCQPCGYLEIDSSDDAVKHHLCSLKHEQYTELKKNLAFMNSQLYWCKACNVQFFCSEDLFNFHNNSKQHDKQSRLCNFKNKTKRKDSESSSTSMPFLPNCDDDIKEEIQKNSLEELQKNMKLILSDILKNKIQIAKRETRYLGFYCSICCFWIRKRNKWKLHLENRVHVNNTSSEQNPQLYTCECRVVIFCSDIFYSDHLSSYEHKNLKSFIAQKLLVSSQAKKSITDASSNPETKSTGQNGNPIKSFFGFQIMGLTDFIVEKDIFNVFLQFGEVEYIDYIEHDLADVYISLRDDYTISYIEGVIKNGLSIDIKGSSCKILEKNKYELSNEVVEKFSNNKKDWFEKLLLDSNEEYDCLYSIPPVSGVNKANVIEQDIMGLCTKAKRAIVVGSRGCALAQPDSVLDVFVKLDDGELSTDMQFCILNEMEAELNDFEMDFVEVRVVRNHIMAKHWSTGLLCKIFFDCEIAVAATEVIRLYATADEKVRQLILIIEEWFKYTGLLECVCWYTVTWMVLYYLMQPKSEIVKPVDQLKDSSSEQRNIIKGWDCTIKKNLLPSDIVLCTTRSVEELLCGFFEFYASVVDIAFVHCPLTGGKVLKTQFPKMKFQKVGQTHYESFTITKGFCLQDPLELDKNLSERLEGPNLYKFKKLCEEMVTLLSKND